jgi:hypothetical protein
MVNERIVANARADVGRRQLRELRLEEERCQFRLARLEAERVRVQALIDLYEPRSARPPHDHSYIVDNASLNGNLILLDVTFSITLDLR